MDLPNVLPPLAQVPNDTKNKVVITAEDKTLWNGQAVSDEELIALLAETRKFATEPELQYEPSASASYDRSLRVLNIIKASGVTRFGFVGSDRYGSFGAGGPADPTL